MFNEEKPRIPILVLFVLLIKNIYCRSFVSAACLPAGTLLLTAIALIIIVPTGLKVSI